MEKGKDGIVMHQHAFLPTLRNILVCESLLFLDEKARNQLKYNFIMFGQLAAKGQPRNSNSGIVVFVS